ncbi:MAG: selenide, water dikinase SelD [Pseudomonadales bacterium]|nr:selenide, water dikinase SelD [Pseudomonadales bacterium]
MTTDTPPLPQNSEENKKVKLTQYSHGAGCGCKIAPNVLETMLKTNLTLPDFPKLMVGNSSKDDAAVYDIGNDQAIVSTTDFFMPIVDDPFDFGRIAATNAISDIYAMGGKPLMAIAILGWPINLLPAEVAQKVLDGGRQVCADAGIPLAGGHSIDAPEPIFGLAVTGIINSKKVKRNNTATDGCLLYLTKPLGVGILSTAQKKSIIEGNDLDIAIEAMTTLNQVGADFAELDYIKAMTDVTGFGLLGHLLELCEGSDLHAYLKEDKIPLLDKVDHYLHLGAVPGGTERNFLSYGHKADSLTERQKSILCDPQTSGGLLVAVSPEHADAFENEASKLGLSLQSIGNLSTAEGSARKKTDAIDADQEIRIHIEA